jgi:uncharacterized membrane protein
MYAPLLALLTACCIGVGEFSAHYPLRHVRALPGAFYSTAIQLILLIIAVLIVGDWGVTDWRGPAILMVAGVFHPGLFFILLLLSVDRLGPARGFTLKSTSPLFGVALAIMFLGERPTLHIWLGLFLVVGGIMYLTVERSARPVSKWAALYPLGAAFVSGLAPSLWKVGIQYLKNPLSGPLFTVIGGVAALLVANTLFSKKTEGGFWLTASPVKGMLLFLPMGALGAVAWVSYYSALTYGSVSEVMPLVQTAPLVSLLLSRLLLGESERVNLRLVISAVCIVLGAVLIILGRA